MHDQLLARLELSLREASCHGSVLCDGCELVPSLARDLEAQLVCEVWAGVVVGSQVVRTARLLGTLGVVRKTRMIGWWEVEC